MKHTINIDGSKGEGGGQVLRSALGLSAATGQPFTMRNVRAGRKKPGLMRQHLTAVLAVAEICDAEVTGAEIGSTELRFVPGELKAGAYEFSVGTAGSCTLVLQTVLPALLTLKGATITINLEGGTHNPYAPPFEFLDKSFFNVLRAMGVEAELELFRHGFFPAGGGKFSVVLQVPEELKQLHWLHRGEIIARRPRCLVAHLPEFVPDKELRALEALLDLSGCVAEVVRVESQGPGNALILELDTATHTTVCTAFGRREASSAAVATELADEVKTFLQYEVPVDAHLADQLLIPLALAGGGSFRSSPLSQHTLTNIETIQHFLDVEFEIKKEESRAALVQVRC